MSAIYVKFIFEGQYSYRRSNYVPFNIIICCWSASKFLIKSLAHIKPPYFRHALFTILYWAIYIIHIIKSIPIFSIKTNFLTNLHQYTIKTKKLPLYGHSYETILNSPSVQIENLFLSIACKDLQAVSYPMVSNIFSNYFNTNLVISLYYLYWRFRLHPLSIGKKFYIQALHISFTSNLYPSSTSFTSECYATIEALQLLFQILLQINNLKLLI